MTTQEAIDIATHDDEHKRNKFWQAIYILINAAEENKKNAEDAEKWRAHEYGLSFNMKECADCPLVATECSGKEYLCGDGYARHSIQSWLAAYRAAQVEAAKKEGTP